MSADFRARPVLLHGAFVISVVHRASGVGKAPAENTRDVSKGGEVENGKPEEHRRPGKAEGEARWC